MGKLKKIRDKVAAVLLYAIIWSALLAALLGLLYLVKLGFVGVFSWIA